MKAVTHTLSLYERTMPFELLLPETVSDFAVLRSIIAAQGLHKDPIDMEPLTMEGPFLSFLGDTSKVQFAVTTSSFKWDRTAVNPEAIAEHRKHTCLQANMVVLYVVGPRAFSELYEAKSHADEEVKLNEDCPYCHRPYLNDGNDMEDDEHTDFPPWN